MSKKIAVEGVVNWLKDQQFVRKVQENCSDKLRELDRRYGKCEQNQKTCCGGLRVLWTLVLLWHGKSKILMDQYQYSWISYSLIKSTVPNCILYHENPLDRTVFTSSHWPISFPGTGHSNPQQVRKSRQFANASRRLF